METISIEKKGDIMTKSKPIYMILNKTHIELASFL